MRIEVRKNWPVLYMYNGKPIKAQYIGPVEGNDRNHHLLYVPVSSNREEFECTFFVIAKESDKVATVKSKITDVYEDTKVVQYVNIDN